MDFQDGSAIEEENEKSNGTSMIAIALGAIGLLAGAVGIYFGFDAKREVSALRESLTAIENRPDKTAGLESKIDELEKGLQAQSRHAGSLNRDLQKVKVDAQTAFSSYDRQLSDTRKQLEATIITLGEVSTYVSSGKRPRTETTTSSTTAATTSTDDSGTGSGGPRTTATGTSSEGINEDGTYTIRDGDTFGAIARRFGTTIEAIQAANPNVEPRYLRIGQRIKMPVQ